MAEDGPAEELAAQELRQSLAKVVVELRNLQELQPSKGVGSLCQVWLPDVNTDAELELHTKGEPFCVVGVADELPMLRCVACRTDCALAVDKPYLLGTPGQVFGSGRPLALNNVPVYGLKIPKAATDTQHPCVHSVLAVPLFTAAEKDEPVGVLEIIQNTEEMAVSSVLSAICGVLEAGNIFTFDTMPDAQGALASPPEAKVDTPTVEEAPDLKSASPRKPAGEVPVSKPGTAGQSSTQTNWDELGLDVKVEGLQRKSRSAARKAGPASASNARSGASGDDSGVSGDSSDGDSDEDMRDAEGNEASEKGASKGTKGGGSGSGAARARRGTGTCGKPGKKLQLHELQAQFGLGLKEAASRLRVCPTTLKRACRRHGIQRWPRRQVLRESGTDVPLSTSSTLAALQQSNGLSSRGLGNDPIAIAAMLASHHQDQQNLVQRLTGWSGGLGGLGLNFSGLDQLTNPSRLDMATGSGVRLAEALNYRNTLDSAGGEGKSGGAKPLPGPSYDQMDMQGFGGDGNSPHLGRGGDDTSGSPALNGLGNLGLSAAFANAGLLDQALRGLTPPSPNQRGDLYDLQRLQHLSSQNRLQQIHQALRKAGSNPSLRQLAQANAFNRQMNNGLGDGGMGGGAYPSPNSLQDLLNEAEALLMQPRRPIDPVLQAALDICQQRQQGSAINQATDYADQLRVMQSLAGGRRPGTGGGEGLPISPNSQGNGSVDDQNALVQRALSITRQMGMNRNMGSMDNVALMNALTGGGVDGGHDYGSLNDVDPSVLQMLAGLT